MRQARAIQQTDYPDLSLVPPPPGRKPGFVILDADLINSAAWQSVNARARDVYGALLAFSDGHYKRVNPSAQTIATKIGCCLRTAKAGLYALAKAGLITVEPCPPTSNWICFTPVQNLAPRAESCTTPVQRVARRRAESCTQTRPLSRPKELKESSDAVAPVDPPCSESTPQTASPVDGPSGITPPAVGRRVAGKGKSNPAPTGTSALIAYFCDKWSGAFNEAYSGDRGKMAGAARNLMQACIQALGAPGPGNMASQTLKIMARAESIVDAAFDCYRFKLFPFKDSPPDLPAIYQHRIKIAPAKITMRHEVRYVADHGNGNR